MILFVLIAMFSTNFVACSGSTTSEQDVGWSLLKPNIDGEENDPLSLFSVGRQVTFKELSEEGIESVIKFIYHTESYKSANETYPILELEKEPAFVVFDKDGMVYKGYSYEELLKFLKAD
ncbi:hypothetical protein ACQCT5_22095 [Sutcliffiella halmapala]